MRANAVDEFLNYYNDLNTQSRQKIWLNRDFVSLNVEALGLRYGE